MKLNECILTDLGSVNRGKSKHRPRNDKSLFGGKYPFIQTGEVKSANFYLNTYSETYNDKGLAQSKLWEEGTLLITIAANIAETAILSIKACFPDSIIGFIPYANKSDVRFVKYYLDYIKKKLQVISQGTTQDNMSVEKLTSMKLFVPDYINQVKIANILSNYDNLIENNNKRIKLLENMAEELYKEWFVRLRFPNYQNTKIVDGIPDGWEKVSVDSLLKQLKGTVKIKSTEILDNGKFAVIDQSKDYIAGFTNEKDINIFEGEPFIIFGDHTRVLKLVNFSFAKGADGVQVLVSNNEKMPQILFYYSLLNVDLSNFHYSRHLKFLKKEKLLLPIKDIANKFVRIVRPFYEEIDLLRNKNQNLKETRDLLLPRVISGKLDIKDLHIV